MDDFDENDNDLEDEINGDNVELKKRKINFLKKSPTSWGMKSMIMVSTVI